MNRLNAGHNVNKYDVIIIGAGMSGLTAASLLAKRGKNVLVIEAQNKPGGSCGIWKRDNIIFEQGVSMIHGFSENGYHPCRYLFDVLEEPICLIENEDAQFRLHIGAKHITFFKDTKKTEEELVKNFPTEEKNIIKFYQKMTAMYQTLFIDDSVPVSHDTIPKKKKLSKFLKHPICNTEFGLLIHKNMDWLLHKYFDDEELIYLFLRMIHVFDQCKANDISAAFGVYSIMKHHFESSYYPAGSTMQMIGKLEKSIEENGGEFLYDTRVTNLCLKNCTVTGVRTDQNRIIEAEKVIYSGNIWSLYDDLLNLPSIAYEPSCACVVFYALIKEECVPDDILPVEYFSCDEHHESVGFHKYEDNENEITVYMMSKNDHSLCPSGYQVITVIGPTFKRWPEGHGEWHGKKSYEIQKERELERIISILRRKYKNIRNNIVYSELASPSTLTHFCLKYHGSIAGPAQIIGQQWLRRQHTQTRIFNLFCCGEGTVSGTGLDAVTTSGISAANLVLRTEKKTEFGADDIHCNYVTLRKETNQRIDENPACRCQYCANPVCEESCPVHMPISSILRVLSVYNFTGAQKLIRTIDNDCCANCKEVSCEKSCIRKDTEYPVSIREIIINAGHVTTKR